MGNYFLYYLIIKPISLLPFWLLYKLSDIFYILVYHIVKYRRKVVYQNLTNAFPNKSAKEIDKIAKEFYSHFCDFIGESIKLISMSEAELLKRFNLLNPEIYEPFVKENKNLILIAGHYGNWEWLASSIPTHSPKHLIFGVYKPLKNKFFNDKMFKIRSKTGIKLITPRELPHAFLENKNNLSGTAFLIDQAPSDPSKSYWTTFLNQDTPILLGTEKFAVKYNYPILAGKIKKIKRGYYTIETVVLCENPATTSKNEITEIHTRFLEQNIQEAPAYWLWSHKRWKHKRTNL